MSRLLLAVVATALVAVGCGAADTDPNLAAAAEKTEGTGSSRFALSGEDATGQGQEKVAIGCTGEADYDAKHVRLSCDYGGQGRMDVVTLGRTSYLRGDLFGFGGSGDRWIEVTDDDGLGEELSPQRLLAMLRGASESTERLGDEQVRGVDTVRYRLVVDCGQADLSDCEGATSPVDVWVDEDGLVRRIAVTEGGSPAFTFEFYDFGADVAIEAPPAADIVAIDQLNEVHPCRPSDGSPLTGAEVSGALRDHGLVVRGVDECTGDRVAVFTVAAPGSNSAGFAHCVVSRSAATGTAFAFEGLQTARVGNAYCAYSDDLAGAMDGAMAALERRIHP